MWSFEGDYKKRPKQSLGGKSRTIDRQSLLYKLRIEREEREEQRKREEATVIIQAWCRGNVCRKEVYSGLRKKCDLLLAKTKQEGLSKEIAEEIITILLRVFRYSIDSLRLINLCQLLIKEQTKLSKWICLSFTKWKFLIPRLVSLSLKNLINSMKENDKKHQSTSSHAVPMRLLEVVSNPDGWTHKLSVNQVEVFLEALFTNLLKCDCYYKSLVCVLNSRLPPLYEKSLSPPSAVAETLLQLALQPIFALTKLQHQSGLSLLYGDLMSSVFVRCQSMSQVRFFLLPALSEASWSTVAPSLLVHMDALGATLVTEADAASMLYSLLQFVPVKAELKDLSTFCAFLNVCGQLLALRRFALKVKLNSGESNRWTSDSDSDEEEEETDEESDGDDDDVRMDTDEPLERHALTELLVSDLNSAVRVSWLLQHVQRFISSPQMLVAFTRLFHQICSLLKFKFAECRLFFSVVLKRQLLLRPMWQVLCRLQQGKVLSSSQILDPTPTGVSLLQVLSAGCPLTEEERDALVPLLSTFSASIIGILATLHDAELIQDSSSSNESESLSVPSEAFPLSGAELVSACGALRDACVGLVDLAHPDSRMASMIDNRYKDIWAHCFKVCVNAIRQLHVRDARRGFCPCDHWLSARVSLPAGGDDDFPAPQRRYRRFRAPRWRTKEQLVTDEGRPLSVTEQRRATLLRELPFVFPFGARMVLFRRAVAAEREHQQGGSVPGLGGPGEIAVAIRRTHLYEDAFEKLSPENERNLRLRLRLHMLNAAGLGEAGIDGGGVFREFLSELLRTAFDPTRGFFLLTKDNTLYPNPSAALVMEKFEKHYYFIGRMLGKALYENLLVEIPLASFFLSKLLSGRSGAVEFHHLDSLDPELCHHLLSLKSLEGEAVRELGLDFTVLTSQLGQTVVEELVPGGAAIPVTEENRIEYIYRVADFKLNRQIARQSQAFRDGLCNVVDVRWLRLFDARELQMLVSGDATPIDVDALKEHTAYSGVYNTEHPTIVAFWRVVSRFDETQRRQLLKFVTSCSRPPLLGFKELYPAFCIHPSGSAERLPTAATCMNLLKLPEYADEDTLRRKLLYAITSSSGFELS